MWWSTVGKRNSASKIKQTSTCLEIRTSDLHSQGFCYGTVEVSCLKEISNEFCSLRNTFVIQKRPLVGPFLLLKNFNFTSLKLYMQALLIGVNGWFMPLETQTNQVSRCTNQVLRICLFTAKEIQIVSIRSSWLTGLRNHGSRSVLEIQLRFRKRLAPECLLNFNYATIYALMNLMFINQWVSRNVTGAPNFLF